MAEPDYDDPKVEEAWVEAKRVEIESYLARGGVQHGAIGEWPAWHLPPLTSVWAVESLRSPGYVGWWAVAGDHPTDYISSMNCNDPRSALRAICDRWGEIAETMSEGKPYPAMRSGPPEQWIELGGKLKTRVAILRECVADDRNWVEAERPN